MSSIWGKTFDDESHLVGENDFELGPLESLLYPCMSIYCMEIVCVIRSFKCLALAHVFVNCPDEPPE